MTTQPTSSMFSAIDYTPESGVLLVTYNSGGKQYSHLVPNEVWDRACEAESFGKFFHAEIKKQYPGTPVPVTDAPEVVEEPEGRRNAVSRPINMKPIFGDEIVLPGDGLPYTTDGELFGGA